MKAAINKSIQNFTGNVMLPDDLGYDESRKIWNAMIDRHPAAIVQCLSADDVQRAIEFARNNKLEISVRGAGHNIAGTSLCDDGVMIDLSLMKNVHIDPAKKCAYVEPGATLADFDQESQKYGLATPVGINSTTGISGLTLGGGFGWLSRKYGMTIDNLISADVVTADGRKLKASVNENPDLFWAIRGGGGNFGIVTQFEFKLHPVGPQILAGLIVLPMEQAKTVMLKYRDFMKYAPPEFNMWIVIRHSPPLPFLPTNVHGSKVIVLPVFYAGDLKDGEKLVESVRKFGKPIGEHVGEQPYAQWQQAFDPLLTPGIRNYWKSHNFTDFSENVMDLMIEYGITLPSPDCEIFIANIEGAPNKVETNATAYPHRDTKYVMNVHGRWEKAALDERCISWSRSFFKATAPYASAGTYVNFMTEDEKDHVSAAYGSNYDRLVQIKRKYDPKNNFHINLNIKP